MKKMRVWRLNGFLAASRRNSLCWCLSKEPNASDPPQGQTHNKHMARGGDAFDFALRNPLRRGKKPEITFRLLMKPQRPLQAEGWEERDRPRKQRERRWVGAGKQRKGGNKKWALNKKSSPKKMIEFRFKKTIEGHKITTKGHLIWQNTFIRCGQNEDHGTMGGMSPASLSASPAQDK